jgi:ATP-binding cassette, subfamily C, bacterial
VTPIPGVERLSSATRETARFARAVATLAPRRTAAAIFTAIGLSLSEGAGLLMLVPLLQLVGIDAQHGPLTSISRLLSAGFASVGLQPTLGLVLAIYVVIIAAQSALQWRQWVLNAALQEDIVTALRLRVHRAIARAEWTFVARSRGSDFSHLLTDEIDRVGSATFHLVDLVVLAATALVYVALAARVAPPVTALVLVCGGALALVMRGRLVHARAVGQRLSASRTRLYAVVSEQLAGMKLARSYGMQQRSDEEFARVSTDLSGVSIDAAHALARLRRLMAIASAALLAVIVYVAYAVLAVPTAQLFLLLFLFARLVPRLTGLYERTQALATTLPAFASVMETERLCLAATAPQVEQLRDVDFTDCIALERVSFTYASDGRSRAANDVDLRINAGETTAIVGPSGAGKSTVADLIMGLVTPDSGRIAIDGRPLTANRVEAWREQIGYVAQDPFLFHASVRANLLWARPHATEPEIWRALRLAAAEDFVRALPQGLDTVLGDRGTLISGGERQRLSLARAIIRRPFFLILDEATSSLDSENEKRIERAIEDLHHTTTMLVITHRLSTIRNADVIHVMEEGRIVESGSWDVLASRLGGRFRQLCAAQGVEVPAAANQPGRVRQPRMQVVR